MIPRRAWTPAEADGAATRGAGLGARLLERIGDPVAWSDAQRCLLVAVASITFLLWYSAPELYAVSRPEAHPYFNPAILPFVLRVQAGILIAWLAVLVRGLMLRRRRAPAPVLVGVTIALAMAQLAYAAYISGPHTNPTAGVMAIGYWAGGLILFPRRPIVVSMCLLWLAMLVTAGAEQAGYLASAPLYRGTPIDHGRLHPSWLMGHGGVTLVLMLFVQVAIYIIIDRWHDRERALAVISRDLAQANEVISRYVASQLAEQIRDGNHSALERHERRRLTLFFSDIQDFAATADLVEPEDLSLQLNEYLAQMTAIAERYGATIDKFVGDAIMIFFGAPAATSDRDQALRAVRMAIDMQDCLVTLRQRWLADGVERPFHVRMGINTGQASVGAFGSPSRLEYTAIGRQVNLAARLQAQCEPDRILLSHSTFTLVRDDIACAPRGEVSVKGFHMPVRTYEVAPPESVSAASDRSRTA
jgi:class 3 adenylate cyclase